MIYVPAPDKVEDMAAPDKVLQEAYTKALSELGFTHKTDGLSNSLTMEKPGKDGKAESKIEIAFVARSRPDVKYRNWACYFTRMPAWISPAQEEVLAYGAYPAYQFMTNKLKITGIESDSEKRDLVVELFDRFAKNLPKNAFVYVPPIKDGTGKVHEPHIADNHDVYYFDKEEIARELKKKLEAAKAK